MNLRMTFFAFGLLFWTTLSSVSGQYLIKPAAGYSPQIGSMVAMLEDLKNRVDQSVRNLSLAQTDFLLDAQANRIGALILHLAATEKVYQVITFENRDLNSAEQEQWQQALQLGNSARKTLVGNPISHYLHTWEVVRAETLALLKAKDDTWFNETLEGSQMNAHWAWFHVMEHQANHLGQIRMIMKRME